MRKLQTLIAFVLVFFTCQAWAQNIGPRLPLGGIRGSAGVGFVDFVTVSPEGGFKLDRGTYVAGAVERPFGFFNLHLVLGINHMSAGGEADYSYTKGAVAYTASDLPFKARMFDLGLGLKLKAFEEFWFRPYIGGGGLGGYHEIEYSSSAALSALGSDYKRKDTVMGSGYYGEVGLEIEFTERFGVQLAARMSDYTSKSVETLGGKKLQFKTETYFFSALMGF